MNLVAFIQEHKSAAAAAGMAAVHFSHLAWPRLVAIFPYCRDNGGAVGIVNQFLFGKKTLLQEQTETTENQPIPQAPPLSLLSPVKSDTNPVPQPNNH